MASIISYILFFSLLFSCIFAQVFADSNEENTKHRHDLIEKVCSQTDWNSFCLKTLRSQPASATADLRGLSNISLNLALSDATKLYPLLPTFISDKELLENFSHLLNRTIFTLRNATNHLIAHDYGKLYNETESTVMLMTDCVWDTFTYHRSLLWPMTCNVYYYCGISCVISVFLQGGNDFEWCS